MRTSEVITEIAVALNKAQIEMLPLVKDSKNPFFKSKYADLKSVTAACYPALQDNGICVVQSPEIGRDGIVTRLIHTSGQWIETCCVIPPTKDDPQQYGSACTYGRRYGLQAAVGLAPEDDDGNLASHQPVAKKAAKKTAKVEYITPQQIDNLNVLKKQAGVSDEKFAEQVASQGADDVTKLTKASAAKLLAAYTKKLQG